MGGVPGRMDTGRGGTRWPGATILVGALVVVAAAALAGAWPGGEATRSAASGNAVAAAPSIDLDPSPGLGSSPPVVTPSPLPPTPSPGPPTPEPPPAWAINLAGQLECDGPPLSMGGETGDFIEGVWGPDPSSMARFLANSPFAPLPGRLDPAERTDDWARYVHERDGRLKTILILTDTLEPGGPWVLTGLRTCDASEFDPAVGLSGVTMTIWRDGSEAPVRTDVLSATAGPGHCGWQSTTFLMLDDELYIRDPDGVLAEYGVVGFDPDVRLPSDAVDTGYHDDTRRLWRTADPDVIYVAYPDHVERWPRASGIGCA